MTRAFAGASFVALTLFLGSCRSMAAHDLSSTQHDVEAVIRAQERAWNAGDIDGFMRAGYLQSPALTFFSGHDVTNGFEPVLERYRRRYKADGAEMGKLEFSELDTLPLGEDHAILRGRWHLDFEKKDDVGGLFTLVFERTKDGWRIVHDHTSV